MLQQILRQSRAAVAAGVQVPPVDMSEVQRMAQTIEALPPELKAALVCRVAAVAVARVNRITGGDR
jgi:hypothetical protein